MHREKLIQLIHVAKSHTVECSKCGHLKTERDGACMCGETATEPMSDDRYRASLEQLTGKRSCKNMNIEELQKVYGMFQRVGFKPVQTTFNPVREEYSSKERIAYSIRSRAPGVLGENWEARLTGFIKHMGVDHLDFCDVKQLRKVQGWLSRTKNKEQGE